MENSYPRLCGGTFLTLLLNEKRQKSKKELYKHGSNELSQRYFFKELILLVDPSFEEGSGTTFETDTSRYKMCKKSKSDYLPFHDQAIISTFDADIKSNYKTLHSKMGIILEKYLHTDSMPMMERLVYSLLNLLKEDLSIDKSQLFILENDVSISKEDILKLTRINLPSLILSFWHYIVMNRKENEVGLSTLDKWLEIPELIGQERKLNPEIGINYTHNLTILNNYDSEPNAESNLSEDTEVEIIDCYENSYQENNSNNQPLITNTFNFYQSGNGVNIGQATNVTIKNGKVVVVDEE